MQFKVRIRGGQKRRKQKVTRGQILEEAKKIVCTDRNAQYGEPEDNFRRVADLWTAYLGPEAPRALTPADVANMMILFKVARSYANSKTDTWVDIAGYAACGGEIAEGREAEDET